jgi:hypothetical protein
VASKNASYPDPTARAFYQYPYEIYPSYYETYKWGLYNELIVLDKQLQCISFALENRTKDRHITRLRLGGFPA